MADDTNTAEREAFEAWFRREYHSRLDRNMPDKSYNDPGAHFKWIGWSARASLAASAVTDCERCSGSGEDPEGFYDQSRGDAGHTHEGPCRSCGGSGVAASAGSEPVAWTGGEEWEQLAWHLCAEDNGEESCDELIWEGGPIPEPWGQRWMKYEHEATRMIELVRKFTHPSPPEGAGWRPIDTAPKDEMYRDGPNAYAEYILVWYPGAIAPIRARWWQSDSGRCNFLADGSYAVFPTVWMPLPAPPLPASEAKEL